MKNPVYKIEGIIIKKAGLGEMDRLLTIYSREHGKIQVRAKSVRKAESKLKGFLELFTHSIFLLAHSKTIDIVTGVEPINIFPHLRSNLNLVNRSFNIVGLINRLVVAPERDESLWQLILQTFQSLDGGAGGADFEERLLEVLGYGNLADREEQSSLEFINSRLNY